MTADRISDDSGELTFPHQVAPRPGKAVEVWDGIYWLRFPLPMALNHVNVFALRDSDGWTLIDTGMNSEGSRAAWRQALDGDLAGSPVRRVILTHHHPDHVGLAGWFKTEFGAEVWATMVSWLMARMLTLDVQERHSDESIAFYRDAGVPEDIVAARLKQRPFNFSDFVHPIPAGFRRLEEGGTVGLARMKWTVRLGGGHASDHATFWCDDAPLIIGGDQFLSGISSNIGVYPTEPEANPLSEWLVSCRRFGTWADCESLVLPGHKLPFCGLDLRLRQLIEKHEAGLELLKEHLKQPRAAAECLNVLFKRELTPEDYSFAIVEAVAHLNYLMHCGEATRTRRFDGAWQFECA